MPNNPSVSKHTYATFVRSSVKTIPLTKAIINDAMPHFPLHTKCIGGYLDDSDQFWKVNYHWELLRKKIKVAIDDKKLNERLIKCAKAVLGVLDTVPPSPTTGYCKSKVVGLPKDTTSRNSQISRWKTLRQCKKDFNTIIRKAGIIGAGRNSKWHAAWYLAVAPVARPGTSKHGVGFALDICGRNKKDNPEIRKIAKELKASVVFDEYSHVHIEFKNGVMGKKTAQLAKVQDGSGAINVAVPPGDTISIEASHEMMCHVNADPTDPEVNSFDSDPLSLKMIAREVVEFLSDPLNYNN